MFKKNKIKILLFVLIFVVFTYLRLNSILLQNYPYTFDQGRDFLKVEEIIKYKNPTLIGPTTGVMGIYHGVQWYYYLAIPYLLFNGNPNGFVFFIFLTHLISFLIFFIFLYKKFNPLTALFALVVSAGSPYFITMSSFAISSTPEISLILFFVILLYKFLETKKPLYQILLFLNLGLIFEQELPVGLFLIPSLILALIITKQAKLLSFNLKYLFFSFFALIIASIPRIIFEIKHNFIQTKVAIDYISHSSNDQTTVILTFLKRLGLFWDFYKSLFIWNNQIIAGITLTVFIFALWFLYEKFDKLKRTFLNILLITITFLFIFTLLYKKEFSTTYLEGLPVMFLIALSIIFYELTKISKNNYKYLSFIVVFILLGLNFFAVYLTLTAKKDTAKGISRQIQVLDYLYKTNENKNFCLRIYTPPVIPHTYDYLISYNARVNNRIIPTNKEINNQCWFIIEKEQNGDKFQERISKWRKENIPEKAKLINKKIMSDETLVELWKK